jgi:hypothetical protein
MIIFPEKLTARDIRTLKAGAVTAVGILLFTISSSCLENWRQIRKSLSKKKTELETLVSPETGQASLISIVPVFAMPQYEEKQRFLFRNKLMEQFKKAGIKTEPLEILTRRKNTGNSGCDLLLVKCSSEKCKFAQILDFLATLKENPYLAAVEELNIKCDPNKRENFELNIVVSTFVK